MNKDISHKKLSAGDLIKKLETDNKTYVEKKNHASVILIEDRIIDEPLILNGLTIDYPIKFDNCILKGGVRINHCTLKTVEFTNQSEVFSHVLISFCRITDQLLFRNNKNKIDLRIHYSIVGSLILIQAINIQLGFRNVYFNNIKAIESENIEINANDPLTMINKLVLGNLECVIFINNLVINTIEIYGLISEKSSIKLNNISCNTIKIFSLINNGMISLNTIEFNNFLNKYEEIIMNTLPENTDDNVPESLKLRGKAVKIGNFKYFVYTRNLNNPLLWIQYIKEYEQAETVRVLSFRVGEKAESVFFIDAQKLGEMVFESLKFDNLNKLQIEKTRLTSLVTYNTVLPFHLLETDEYKYDILNDMYSISKSKCNKKEELLYYKASQNTLFKNSSLIKEPGTVLSLWIPKIYSSFGTKWLQSVLVTIFAVGILFFSLMMLSTTHDLDISIKGINEFWRLKADFAKFINPTHKLTFMDIKDVYRYSDQFCFIIWDSLGRIFIGIGIFETIRSFRKYTRK